MTREFCLLFPKSYGTLFAKYKGNALRLSKEFPHTVDEVVVGRKGTDELRKITTFRDASGRIIERAYDYSGKPFRNVLYDLRWSNIGEDEMVDSTIKREFQMPREFLNTYLDFQKQYSNLGLKTCFWELVKTETEHLSQNINTGVKILTKSGVTFVDDAKKWIHRFTEFPHLLSKKVKNDVYKFLYFESDNNGKVIPETIFEDGVKFPKNDSFIAYRALDIESAKVPLTNKFLKDRKIDSVGIIVETDYIPSDEEINRLSACFIAEDGSVNFNKFYYMKSKQKLVRTARHEVEHGWQYYLDARNGSNSTHWQRFIYDKFGPIPDKNRILQAEADKCTEAIDNYVTFNENYEKYKNNYIEVEAEKKGKTIQNKYVRHGKKLSNEFPHIPKELL